MPLPLKKRPYRGSSYAPSAKRIRRIERQVYRNRAEMQTNTQGFSAAIAPGTRQLFNPVTTVTSGSGIDQRKGDRIRLFRIELRGVSDSALDYYIIQKKGSTDPAVTHFGGQKGAYLADSENTSRFTEWYHTRTREAGNEEPIKISKRFKGGIVQKFNATSGSPVDNEIVIVILNRDTASASANVSCRIWYTDA